MGHNLNPQALGYYKRLMLVSDRYLVLNKKYNNMKLIAWCLFAAVIVLGLVILRGHVGNMTGLELIKK